MPDPIHPDVLADPDALATRFRDAQPFRHVVIDDFMRADFVTAMLDAFPPFDTRGAIDENGKVGGKSTFENVKRLGGVYVDLDQYLQSPAFLSFMQRVTGIDDLLYDPLYYGGGTHDNRHGQELDPHVDFNYHAKYGWHRRLNLILYLNREWQPEWEGAIQFHRNPWGHASADDITTVVPVLNRCVIFETTETSWHGFQPIHLPEDRQDLSRKSFAIYLYTRERPESLTAPAHDTIYVERPMPEHLVPGHVLTEADRAEIKRLLDRRDLHLRRLYGREQKFSETIASLREQLDAESGVRRAVRATEQKLRPLLYRMRRRWRGRS